MKIRHIIDAAMVVLMPLLMAYALFGEGFHEIAGTALFVLFLAHQIVNRRWYGALYKGKYTPHRTFRTVLNGLLWVIMIGLIVSAVLISRHLYTPLAQRHLPWPHKLHMLAAYWGYVLMSVHAGTHMTAMLRNRWARAAAVLVFAYGTYAFIRRDFVDCLFLRAHFAPVEPRGTFIIDYIAVMAACVILGAAAVAWLNKLTSPRVVG
ncbi:MAG: hypothetical protein J6U98_08360 [Abditibacteriota bacterium]|nr:hypothetical protein [Abditibacteriota bacterium]